MTVRIGDIYTTNNFGRFKIGKWDGEKHCWIVFENTGNVQRVAVRLVVANGVVDYKGAYHIQVGGLYNTSNYGKVRVLKIVTTKEVTIEFVETGNRIVTLKENILSGLLVDKLAIAIREKEIQEEKVQLREQQRLLKEEEKRLAEEEAKAAQNKIKEEKENEKRVLREFKRTLNSKGEVFIGTKHTDKLEMEFEVLARAEFSDKWVVKYLISGNSYEVSESHIGRQSVFDRKLDDFYELKAAYDKKQSALWYQANREKTIQRCSAYQKLNLNRSRVNNQNRRARREGAEGRHTLEETDLLFQSQEGKCACCGVQLDDSNKHLDHVMPLALGGTNFIWNLQWLCQFCNNSKSATHPDEWEIYSKSEHFKEVLKQRGQVLQ